MPKQRAAVAGRSSAKATKTSPAWIADAAFYQIYPQSFQDTNGDGIGDIPGIIGRLDYIRSLGCNAIWLNPVFASPFGDAGYDISDFRKVAPRYGTRADLRRLFREAHRRDMRVVLDLVAGHTSAQHPWFKSSCSPRRNRYSDYYIWTPDVWTQAVGCPQINGFSERDGNYVTNFFWFQPALNYGFHRPDPAQPWQQPVDAAGPRAVKAELQALMKFWLDQGCDGFRVDMAASLVRGDIKGEGIRAFWQEFRAWFDADYPEAVLVSEWSDPRAAIGAGFHIDFLIHFGDPAYQKLCNPWGGVENGFKIDGGYFHKSDPKPLSGFLDNYLAHHRATRGKGYIALPTGNHDLARFLRGRTPAEQRVLHAMLLTMPGVPFIYYGDEIGLTFREGLVSKEGGYVRTGTRAPMQWSRGRNAGFSTAPKRDLYLPIDPDPKRSCVADQENDTSSMLHLVRRLLALRKEVPALGNDSPFQPVDTGGDGVPFLYRRGTGRRSVLVAINPSDRTVTAHIPTNADVAPLLAEGVEIQGGQLRMNPVSFGIFQTES